MFAVPGAVPPIVLSMPPAMSIPFLAFGSAIVPVASVPMRLPSIWLLREMRNTNSVT